MLETLLECIAPLDMLRSTKIALVLKSAARRKEFHADGTHANVGKAIERVQNHWRSAIERFIRQEIGL